MLRLRSAQECEFDAVALGEVMLRLDPGENRIRCARQFDVWEGGGEYNVARGLSAVFGLRAAVLTGLPRTETGQLVEGLIRGSGVSPEFIHWMDYDGVGERGRLGLNFTERGFGVRGAVGVSDRAHTVAATLTPAEFDLDDLFGRRGVRWFHTGGVFAALSPQAAELAEQAMSVARRHGTAISYDLNYRESLWRRQGGCQAAQAVNQKLAPMVDVMLGNEEDFAVGLGVAADGVPESLDELPVPAFEAMIQKVSGSYPNLQVVATTLRRVLTASSNDWGAIAWDQAGGFVQAPPMPELEIFDRVGGGDSFASGLIYGLLTGRDLAESVKLGSAHGALAMTTPGDVSQADLAQVKRLAAGGNARVVR